jgi:hypothetical protein
MSAAAAAAAVAAACLLFVAATGIGDQPMLLLVSMVLSTCWASMPQV